MTSAPEPPIRSVIVEADGGSRGNPGPAAYGALLVDADTGRILAEDATRIGRATNNVAEYSGLLAGLRLAETFAPDAEIEVRMDSKLVVEQMAGRWKVKHPDLVPLALEANRLAPFGTVYTWVPRARNARADRLANQALDGTRHGVSVPGEEPEPAETPGTGAGLTTDGSGQRGWSRHADAVATTLVLVRHGVTEHTAAKRFSGGLGGLNPALTEDGRAQVRAAAQWLSPLADSLTAVVSSPVRRARETAELLAARLGDRPIEVDDGFAETEFGVWEGLTFSEVARRHPEDLTAWLDSVDVAPPGGESFDQVRQRVLAARDRLLAAHAGGTVVIATHVTPIKILVAEALAAPLTALFRMELTAASVSVISYHGDQPSLRLFNALPGWE